MTLPAYIDPTDPLLVAIAVGAGFAVGVGLGWLINWAYRAIGRRT
jgi:RsiW-degrading membrane proteinase PrsW (M82 family)